LPWLRATLEKDNLKNSLNVEVLLSNHEISQHVKPQATYTEALNGNNENDAGFFTSHNNLALLQWVTYIEASFVA